MSFDVLGDLNWLAVVVAAVAYFALGGIWYAQPVLGRAWVKATGIDMSEGDSPGATFYIVPFAVCFVATLAMAMLVEATGSDAVGNGIVLGVVVGIGIAFVLTMLGGIFDQKPNPAMWVAIVGGYHVVGLLGVAVILSAWA